MKYKKGLVFICLIICLFSISSVCAGEINSTEDAMAQEEISIDDQTDDLGAIQHDEVLEIDDGTFTALQNKINNATEGSTITLENDYLYNGDFSTGGITISKSLTINGNGKIIDAGSKSRIFNIGQNNDVILKNIIFVNGYSENDGGSINVMNSNLTIIDSTFKNSTANNGGALSLQGNSKNSSLINCTFENNRASKNGGAIYISGDAYDSIFWGNFKSNLANNSGGALYVGGSISNSVFSGNYEDNQANDYGGAIYAENIVSSTFDGDFTGNTANIAGAVYANVMNSIFNGNFEDNYADYGGAIFGNISDSTFNGDFRGNGAGSGGAICGDVSDSIFNGDFIYNAAVNTSSTTNEILGSAEHDVLNFMPAVNVGGGVISGNVMGSTFNSNFVANTAKIGAVIAGNVEKSVFTGKFSRNTGEYGIIVSGNTLKSIFSGGGEDIIQFEGKLFGDLIDSSIKDKYMNKEDRERLENLSEYFVDIEADLNIYVDEKATVDSDKLSVTYKLNLVNLLLEKTIDFKLSKLKKIMNPFEGPMGVVVDNLLDELSGDVREKLIGDRFKGYLTFDIRTCNNLKDAIDIANRLGLLYKNDLTRLNIHFSLDDLSVKIAPGVYRGDKNKGLVILTNYTLMKDGEGDVIIDAENNGNILTVMWHKLKIDGLTFMHASDSAIIFKHGLYDSLINANFIDNYKKNSSSDPKLPGGSAIMLNGNIIHSILTGIFQNNNAQMVSGGTIAVGGYAGYNIEDCIFNATFINNTGSSTNGALLCCDKIINSIFSGNFIENKAYDSTAIIDTSTIIDSTFSGNFINNEAIGLYTPSLISSRYNILDSKFSGYFSNNKVMYGVIYATNISNCIFDGVFKNNSAWEIMYGASGLIRAENMLNSIFNGTFINNEKGLIAVPGNIMYCDFNGNFINNTMYYADGGAVICCKGTITHSSFNGNFIGNSVNKYCGGVIYVGNIINCEFNGIYRDNNAGEAGGVIFIKNIISYCTFNGQYSGNYAEEGNVLFAFHFYDYDGNNYHNSANIPRSDVHDDYYHNNVLGCSDNLCSSEFDNILTVPSNDLYVDATATTNGDGSPSNPFNNLKSAIDIANDGDAIYIYPGTYTGENNIALSINKSLNLVKIGNGEAVFDAQNNGRIFTISNDSFNITGLTFAHATDSAIVFDNGIADSKIEANFENNKNKAALRIIGIAINSIFSGNFINNTANGDGAAICADNIVISVLNGNFINNTAVNGGAIAGNVIDSAINGNFKDNNAANGGAIAGNIMKSVVNAKFANNTASVNGGAIYGNVSSSNFTDSFESNGAVKGGVIFGSVSSCSFCNDIIENHASEGGVICGSVSLSNFNCNFKNNTAGKASIVSGKSISKSVFNAEFVGNMADADYGMLFYAAASISDSKFLGEIFVSNLTNVPDLVYGGIGVVNCIFNDYVPQPIYEKDIIIPSLSTGSGTVKLPNDATGTITLNIAGKEYTFPVVNGAASIKVPQLANGNYPYTITYSGDFKYSSFNKTGSLTVNKPSQQTTPAKPVTKTTLTLKKVKVKRSAKKLTIQATLKVNGKAVKGKIIKFKFNKKSYKAKTNAKGVAKITVKKAVLKKLKKGKKVTYTAKYGKITKKVTVKVK